MFRQAQHDALIEEIKVISTFIWYKPKINQSFKNGYICSNTYSVQSSANRKKNTALLIVMGIFALIYASVSLVNHYLFRTYALDLGMFNHALYSFAHFKLNVFTLGVDGAEVNYFGDHFSPLSMLYAPFYYLFGSYTLLMIQIAAILAGGLGIYRYARLVNDNHTLSILILIQFFSIWGIYSALSFDFHNNVVAAMLVPWLIYYHTIKNRPLTILFFILILIAKENMALWLVFIMIGLMVKGGFREYKGYLRFEIPLLMCALVYFIVAVRFLMPAINHGQGTNQLARYGLLGHSLFEIINTIVLHTKYAFSLLFENTQPEGVYFGIKSELHFMVLVSGGFALLYAPHYLVMLIPIYMQKLFTNDPGIWGIDNQYSIEFVPILSLCMLEFAMRYKKHGVRVAIGAVCMFTTLFFTIKSMDRRRSVSYSGLNTRFYSAMHYRTLYNIKGMNIALEQVPKDAVVSTNSPLAPRLAFRDKIYHFPIIKDATYIVLLNDTNAAYPLNIEGFKQKVEEYRRSSQFATFYDKDRILIFRRNK